MSFQQELGQLINKYSQENCSNTPDFILARYITGCLGVFNEAVDSRELWYGRKPQPINVRFDSTAPVDLAERSVYPLVAEGEASNLDASDDPDEIPNSEGNGYM